MKLPKYILKIKNKYMIKVQRGAKQYTKSYPTLEAAEAALPNLLKQLPQAKHPGLNPCSYTNPLPPIVDPYSPCWVPIHEVEYDANVAGVFIEEFIGVVGYETELNICNLTSTINHWADRYGLANVTEDMVEVELRKRFGKKWVGIRLL